MSTRRHNAAIGPLFPSETFADQFARSALRLSWPCFRTGFKSEWHEPTSGRGKGEAPAWRFAHVDQGKVPTSRLDFRPLGHFTDNAGHKTVSFPQNGKWVVIRVYQKINANGREFGKPLVRGRITQCPRRARLPASPAASHAHTTCSGPREPGVAAASTARRGRFERPRLALAPRPPRPPELRGACGRAACAPRLSARRRLSSVTAEPRAPPNPQVSERAKACKARRTR